MAGDRLKAAAWMLERRDPVVYVSSLESSAKTPIGSWQR
jgi:hypothetical protein